MKAIWNNTVLAESDETRVVENNHYFPKDAVKMNYFKHSDNHTWCPWKGKASYYDIEVNNELLKDAAWYYPHPSKAAKKIENHIAFWKEVQITE